MNRSLFSIPRLACSGFLMTALTAPASAAVLYSDDFSGSAGQASINSTAETPSTGNYFGTAGLILDGNGLMVSDPTFASPNNGNLRRDIDETQIDNASIITVTWDVSLNGATGAEWIGFGFGNNDSGAPLASNGSNTGLPWLQIVEGSGQVNFRSGEALDVAPVNMGNVSTNSGSTIVWTINTQTDAVSVTIDGGTAVTTTLDPSVTPTYSWVMFRSFSAEAATAVDAISVEVAPIPEPGSMALASAGLVLVLMRRRSDA